MSAQHQIRTKPPKSDVSPWVGLVGVASLIAWVIFCRNWPSFASALDLDWPQGRLSGPFASLASVFVIGFAMCAWSILVDKVHRNPSTGLDWDNPRPLSEVIHISVTKLAGLWATWVVIGFLYCVGRWYWQDQYLFAMQIIGIASVPVFLLSIPYVLWIDRRMIEPRDHSWHFGAMLIGREAWNMEEVKKHCRSWGIKGFFIAFMIAILPPGFANIVNVELSTLPGNPVAIGSSMFDWLFVIDVQIGTVGYLVTFRPLDAHIRSGNPYLGGWVSALICYPPLVFGIMATTGGVIGYEYHTADWSYWLRNYEGLLWAWVVLLGCLTAIYAWATVAFGIRFSNLTYRGVLTNGPYRFSRHPAYLSKNLFWWFSVLPFFVTSGSMVDMIRNTFFLGCISAVYYWRARTEEAHLLGEDPKYREYYDWMAEHGLVTSRLRKLFERFGRRPPAALQPAE